MRDGSEPPETAPVASLQPPSFCQQQPPQERQQEQQPLPPAATATAVVQDVHEDYNQLFCDIDLDPIQEVSPPPAMEIDQQTEPTTTTAYELNELDWHVADHPLVLPDFEQRTETREEPPPPLLPDGTCVNCLRISTDQVALDMQRLCQVEQRRYSGRLRRRQLPYYDLCLHCRRFLSKEQDGEWIERDPLSSWLQLFCCFFFSLLQPKITNGRRASSTF